MKFECFYCPKLQSGSVIRCNDGIKEFNYGDIVPSKTIFYNYGKNFAIYQGGEFYVVEDSILIKSITKDELKYPLKLVFNKGTQLTVFSAKDLPSVRLLLKGENELEKELGDLFYLSIALNRKIKSIQYRVMAELTNSSRDSNYMNNTLDSQTGDLLEELQEVESKFYTLTINNPSLKDNFLNYMNFGNKENLFEISINKYFVEGTEQYNDYKLQNLVWESRPIFPKFKLDNLFSSCNYKKLEKSN